MNTDTIQFETEINMYNVVPEIKSIDYYAPSGTTIEQGEPICNIETKKYFFEVDAPSEGVIYWNEPPNSIIGKVISKITIPSYYTKDQREKILIAAKKIGTHSLDKFMKFTKRGLELNTELANYRKSSWIQFQIAKITNSIKVSQIDYIIEKIIAHVENNSKWDNRLNSISLRQSKVNSILLLCYYLRSITFHFYESDKTSKNIDNVFINIATDQRRSQKPTDMFINVEEFAGIRNYINSLNLN